MQIINKRMGKVGKDDQEIRLQGYNRKISHPQEVADTLNSYFIDKMLKNSWRKARVRLKKRCNRKPKFNVQ